uniref:Uncharacterized protein n=1 Tax=Cannabis sativa TaxID=3483 RepID=A0A803Q9G1_CANSA
MSKKIQKEEVELEEEVLENKSAPKLVLNNNPWEMDQYMNKFRIYNNLRKYEILRGLESVSGFSRNGTFSVYPSSASPYI